MTDIQQPITNLIYSSMSRSAVKHSPKQGNMTHSGRPPKHVKYKEYLDRLGSFVAWPIRYVPKTPEELSTAGFFYIGSADRVTCFQCGITLRDWEADHNAVEEHRRYSADCDFINRTDMPHLGVSERNSTSGHLPSGASITVNNVERSDTRQSDTGSFECFSTSHMHSRASNILSDAESTPRSASVVNSTEALLNNLTINGPSSANRPLPTGGRNTDPVSSTSASEEGLLKTVMSDQVITAAQGPPELHPLLTENKRLKEQRMCRVCRTKDAAILFLPCGHLVTCPGCADSVHDCVACGRSILGTVKTYLA
ncbi:baculoviral IAP repeat-containing protein 7-like [Haliotis rubra]|uniref:baculoviral IAP repeat-containing protein 7-like n=1 Tax=Haliotis rubra TaxID=36100 RepID=UPI001EE55BFC|nr:baculoviral IAP repeat-containing protein 7-like [Haliotis rubra]